MTKSGAAGCQKAKPTADNDRCRREPQQRPNAHFNALLSDQPVEDHRKQDDEPNGEKTSIRDAGHIPSISP